MSKVNWFSILSFLLSIVYIIHSNEIEYIYSERSIIERLKFWKAPQVNIKYQFNKFSAVIPEELYFLIQGFKNKSILLNRLILYGPPGNGKSSLANQIAKELNAHFMDINGPTIVSKFQGSGAQNIQKTFETAVEYVKFNKNVLIFIDEIDSLAPNFNEDDRFHDYKSALQALWVWLDKIKDMPGIFIICATNNFKKLNKAFISRFDGNIIELKNPEKIARADIIKFYIKSFNKNIIKPIIISPQLINYLIDKTSGLNARTIEGIVRLIIQKANFNNEEINTLLISYIVNRQKEIFKAETDKQKDKKDSISKIKTNLTIISTTLSVVCSISFLYDRYVKNKNEDKFWNPILQTAKLAGMEDTVNLVKNNSEEIAKVSNAATPQALAVIGYQYVSDKLSKDSLF